jgi:opacity protein-like surface antigen
MVRAKILSLAVATTLLSPAAFAADLPPPLPPPVYRAPVVVETGGWYLRGFVGVTNQFISNISHPDFATAPQFVFLDKGGFDSGPFGGGGIGYQWNNWFRVDATIEYRGKVGFHALDRFFNPFFGGGRFDTNQYTASKSEWVGLVNAYLDLGTWWCITPFVGAGVGVAYNKIEHFRDVNVITAGGGWADTGTQTNFAWALHAGAAYKVTPGFAVELSYRYLNLGKAQTGLLVNLDPTVVSGNPLAPVTFNNLQSHDIMLSMRWMLQQEAPMPPPPLMRKG